MKKYIISIYVNDIRASNYEESMILYFKVN